MMRLLLFCLSLFIAYDCSAGAIDSKTGSSPLCRIEDFVTIDSSKMPHQFAIEVANVHTVLACFIAESDLEARVSKDSSRQIVQKVAQEIGDEERLFKQQGFKGARYALLLKMSATGFDWFAYRCRRDTAHGREHYKPKALAGFANGVVTDDVRPELKNIDFVLHINHDRIESYFNERMKECFIL